MKKQYKYLIMLILVQLSLTSCVFWKDKDELVGGPQSSDCKCVSFETLVEFKEVFGEIMAYPSYYPFEIDTEDGVNFSGLAYPEKEYLNLPREEFKKKLEIYTSISIIYSFYDGEYKEKDGEPYKLSHFDLSCFIKEQESSFINPSIHIVNETLEYEGFKVDYIEQIYSKIFDSNIDSNLIVSEYYMEFDKKKYKFVFRFDISQNVVNKEEFLELRDKIKTKALEEVVKSYKTMKYENKD